VLGVDVGLAATEQVGLFLPDVVGKDLTNDCVLIAKNPAHAD
jgi:hypothetical protein